MGNLHIVEITLSYRPVRMEFATLNLHIVEITLSYRRHT